MWENSNFSRAVSAYSPNILEFHQYPVDTLHINAGSPVYERSKVLVKTFLARLCDNWTKMETVEAGVYKQSSFRQLSDVFILD